MNSNYEYLPAFLRFQNDIHVLHFIGMQKPWKSRALCDSLGFIKANLYNGKSQNVHELWWSFFEEVSIGDLDHITILRKTGNLQPRPYSEKFISEHQPHDDDDGNHDNNNTTHHFESAAPEEPSLPQQKSAFREMAEPLKGTISSNNDSYEPAPFTTASAQQAPFTGDRNLSQPSKPLHFPTFYYKPSPYKKPLKDHTSLGEAFNMKETHVSWPSDPFARFDYQPFAPPRVPETHDQHQNVHEGESISPAAPVPHWQPPTVEQNQHYHEQQHEEFHQSLSPQNHDNQQPPPQHTEDHHHYQSSQVYYEDYHQAQSTYHEEAHQSPPAPHEESHQSPQQHDDAHNFWNPPPASSDHHSEQHHDQEKHHESNQVPPPQTQEDHQHQDFSPPQTHEDHQYQDSSPSTQKQEQAKEVYHFWTPPPPSVPAQSSHHNQPKPEQSHHFEPPKTTQGV
ncbi:unnamed protein product [Ambrosiozyma monospora]|uniref:Unnamed protein product n=1 Tax=Ambrosiozyma monospora TaxID=43982 RepID=A0A9W6Z112_AMBMO|nr:unnamed protein product [Ambrosiozyma monospora]